MCIHSGVCEHVCEHVCAHGQKSTWTVLGPTLGSGGDLGAGSWGGIQGGVQGWGAGRVDIQADHLQSKGPCLGALQVPRGPVSLTFLPWSRLRNGGPMAQRARARTLEAAVRDRRAAPGAHVQDSPAPHFWLPLLGPDFVRQLL